MSKRNETFTTSAVPSPTRRAVLSVGAAVLAASAVPLSASTALPGTEQANRDLAAVRSLIAELVAIDGDIGAAERAHDDKRLAFCETRHTAAYKKLRELQSAIEGRPPACFTDLVARAELVGYEHLHGSRPEDWDGMLDVLDTEPCPFNRAKVGLGLAVLWMAGAVNAS